MRPGKTLLRRLEELLYIARDDPNFVEHYNVVPIYNAIYQDEISCLRDLSNLGFVEVCLDIILYFQTQFTQTEDLEGDEEYLAILSELEKALRNLGSANLGESSGKDK